MEMLAQYVKPMFEQLKKLTEDEQVQTHNVLPTKLPPLLPPTGPPPTSQVNSVNNPQDDDIESVEGEEEVALLPWQKEQQEKWFRLKEEAARKREMGIEETPVQPSIDVVPMQDEEEDSEAIEANNSDMQHAELQENSQGGMQGDTQMPGDQSPVISESNPIQQIQQLQQQILAADAAQQQTRGDMSQQALVQRPSQQPMAQQSMGGATQQQSSNHMSQQNTVSGNSHQKPVSHMMQQRPLLGTNRPQQSLGDMSQQNPGTGNSQQQSVVHAMARPPPISGASQQQSISQIRPQHQPMPQQQPMGGMPHQNPVTNMSEQELNSDTSVQQTAQRQHQQHTHLLQQKMEAKRQYQRHYDNMHHLQMKFQRPSLTGYSLHKLHDPTNPGVISHDSLYKYNHMNQHVKQQPSKKSVVC